MMSSRWAAGVPAAWLALVPHDTDAFAPKGHERLAQIKTRISIHNLASGWKSLYQSGNHFRLD
jgi:hypothetical protein